MTYDPENVFAKILRSEIPCDRVYEDDWALAFKDINPQAPVHILVVPKGEYVSSDDFAANASDAEIAGFFRAIGEIARLSDIVNSGYRILANHGRDGHQEVPHFHIHIFGGRDLGGMIKRAST
ncbi:MAG: Purine nucleoside phosphoramidase [Alphaproteobacteria bacterium MarineAlpha3_Bin4]|nr:histidine triad nucleotide-binding protein [Pseudomonadota bacterium]PPR74674.1 MAG: Purine nucleoside phosphoramidase [Alphaproteobacteria bacterium MarineAlpha3_Bin4]